MKADPRRLPRVRFFHRNSEIIWIFFPCINFHNIYIIAEEISNLNILTSKFLNFCTYVSKNFLQLIQTCAHKRRIVCIYCTSLTARRHLLTQSLQHIFIDRAFSAETNCVEVVCVGNTACLCICCSRAGTWIACWDSVVGSIICICITGTNCHAFAIIIISRLTIGQENNDFLSSRTCCF